VAFLGISLAVYVFQCFGIKNDLDEGKTGGAGQDSEKGQQDPGGAPGVGYSESPKTTKSIH